MRPFEDGPAPRRIDYIQPAGRSIGRSGEFDTSGCVVEAGWEFNGLEPVPAVAVKAITSKGKIGSAEIMIHAEAAGDVGAFMVEAFCRQATPEARDELLARLRAICTGEPAPEPGVDAPVRR